jgi:hypothetical protein
MAVLVIFRAKGNSQDLWPATTRRLPMRSRRPQLIPKHILAPQLGTGS